MNDYENDSHILPTAAFNLPLARKVLEYVTEEHDDFVFDMGTWFDQKQYGICKTSACLAGTAIYLSPEANIEATVNYNARVTIDSASYSFGEAGRQLLGLTAEQKDLFYCTNTEAIKRLKWMVEQAEKMD